MVVVTHEMGFARKAANRVVFMADGQIVEEATPEAVLHHTRSRDRAKDFLGKILHPLTPHTTTDSARPAPTRMRPGRDRACRHHTPGGNTMKVRQIGAVGRRIGPRRSASPPAAAAVGQRQRRRRRRQHVQGRHQVRPAGSRPEGGLGLHRLRRRRRDLRRQGARPRGRRHPVRPGARAPSARRSSRPGRSTWSSRPTRSPTSARPKVSFAGPYFIAGQDLLVRADDTSITGPETLTGKKLCSVTGLDLGAEGQGQVPRRPAAGVRHLLRVRRRPRLQGRRRPDDRQHDPRRLRRAGPVQGQAQGRRQDLLRGALRHRHQEGRQGDLREDQRRAEEDGRRRLVAEGRRRQPRPGRLQGRRRGQPAQAGRLLLTATPRRYAAPLARAARHTPASPAPPRKGDRMGDLLSKYDILAAFWHDGVPGVLLRARLRW